MNLKELRELRETKRREMGRRETTGKRAQVIVGMGTCGIAAGAKQTLDAFLDELGLHNLQDVTVRQTGCMGLCYAEPTVEVIMPDMPPTIYGRVDEQTARDIVRNHIVGRSLVNNHIFDRPAADIINPPAAAAGSAAGRAARGGK